MNIDQIRRELDDARAEFRTSADAIEARLFEALTAQWDADTQLQAELVATECDPAGYQFNEFGEIESWKHAPALSMIADDDRELFERYAADRCVGVDWENNALTMNQGDDNIIIWRGGWRRDNGVFQSGKMLFDEDECRTDGDWDDAKTAHLIEAHMEAEGCFPGVFTADDHGNVFTFASHELAKGYVAPVEAEDEE